MKHLILLLAFAVNAAANAAVRYLNLNAAQESSSLSKLSSGSRITSASDDAAGLAISTRISSDVTTLQQAATNTAQEETVGNPRRRLAFFVWRYYRPSSIADLRSSCGSDVGDLFAGGVIYCSTVAGSRTVKVEPFPRSLDTLTSPFSKRQKFLVMARPSPVPP